MDKIIATPSQTKAILAQFNLFAKKNYGQNFLIESGIVDKIARIAIKDETYKVIEIGPGIGALTQYLCHYSKHVVAYEIDERLPAVLAHTLGEYTNFELIMQDFLTVDINAVVERLKEDGSKIVVVANLPYYITTPILFQLFEAKTQFDGIYVMMQKEVGERFCAKVNDSAYNALSMIAQKLYVIKQELKVPANVFMPKPKVDSVVLSFIATTARYEDHVELFALVKACFKQRRKTILNNYSEFVQDKGKALEHLIRANIDPQVRAQACDWDIFERLYEVYRNDN